MNEEDKHTVVIKTNTMFAVDIVVNVKVNKSTSYGNPEPEYELAEVAGVGIFELDWSTKDSIISNIQKEAFDKVKKCEEEIRKEG